MVKAVIDLYVRLVIHDFSCSSMREVELSYSEMSPQLLDGFLHCEVEKQSGKQLPQNHNIKQTIKSKLQEVKCQIT